MATAAHNVTGRAVVNAPRKRLSRRLPNGLVLFRRVLRRLRMVLLRPAFKQHGRNFIFDPYGTYTYDTIEVGNDVSIGAGATFIASESGIVIGSKVMFGPNVTIIGGDHNTSVVGQFMYDVHEKRPQDDRYVIVEDDVWVGACAIILKGVTLGRGCIVAAGALVTRSVPPYAVVSGIPARVRSLRFDVDTLIEHEKHLYPPEKRLSRECLAEIAGQTVPDQDTWQATDHGHKHKHPGTESSQGRG